MKLIKLNCPNCNAKFEINADTKKFVCNYCGTTTLLDDESRIVKHISSNLQNKINEIEEYYENGNYNKALLLSEDALEDYPTNKALLDLKNKSLDEIKKNDVEEEKRKQKEISYNDKDLSFITKIVVSFICLMIVLSSIVIIICGNLSNNSKEKENVNKEQSDIQEVGKEFYEDYYWDDCEKYNDRKEFLAKFKEIGIKVSLRNLLRWDATIDDSYDWSSKYDLDESRVIIYPKEPYGRKDYTISVDISKIN